MNAEIERGRGGKSVFSPNKDLGTRVGDEQGTGKYFPLEKLYFSLFLVYWIVSNFSLFALFLLLGQFLLKKYCPTYMN